MNLSIQADTNVEAAAIHRPLAVAPSMKFDKRTIHMSGVRGTTGPGYTLVIQNRSAKSFKLVDRSFIFSGPDADKFAIVGGRTSRTVQPGAKALYKIAVKPGANESLSRVLTATLSIKASAAPSESGRVNLRAIALEGEGGNFEPSLQRIMSLYGYGTNVGDANPATTALELTPGASTDEVFAPRFTRSGSGPVQITPIAQFVSDAPVPGRLGYYKPGSPDDRTELFSLNEAFNQAVAPDENGTVVFDPGTSPFSLYAQIPVFVDDGEPRRIYSEDALNTWESNADERRKVRVYSLKENGKTVADAYVVTFEDYDLANDQNDYVYVIRGVTPLKSGPELGLIALADQPFADRLAFNEIGTKNTTYPNRVLNEATVRIVNTGNRDLLISNIALGSNTSNFQIVSGGGAATIGRNGTRDVTVRFTATGGDLSTGSLIITSNDRDEGTTVVSLGGFWQSVSESNSSGVNQEPDLQELLATFDFGTKAVYSGQSLDTGGRREAVGDEILSSYWERADDSFPVKVTDLATFHAQGSNDELGWYLEGQPFYGASDPRYDADTNGPRNTLFRTGTYDGQTLLPRTTTNTPAVATFATDGKFGFRVNGEFSDDSLNIIPSGQTAAHHWRFYPARNPDGTYIPNTYLGVMDFSAINYDYNDNLFLIENVRPSDRPASPVNLAGYASKGDAVLDWESVPFAARYQVSRATSINGNYSVIASNVRDHFFVDGDVEASKTYYYRVAAVGSNGLVTVPDTTSVRV